MDSTVNIRLRILLIFILITGVVLTVRIIYLATLDPAIYQTMEERETRIKRGDIFDRNGYLLAVSDELYSVYANPRNINDSGLYVSRLAPVLKMPREEIRTKLSRDKTFVWLKRMITPEQADAIRKLELQEVFLEKEYKRYYPHNTLASHILGFCNIDSWGVEGIERSMDSYLLSEIDTGDSNEEGNEGLSVVLTIDANLQAFAEHVLRKRAMEEKCERASFVLLDGITGEIMVMANWPDFNPNFYSEYDQSSFRNNAIFNQFEPGSVFKVFGIASLVDLGRISRSTFFNCDGEYRSPVDTVSCTGVHGTINFQGIAKYSCNDAMLQSSELLTKKELYTYLKLFGFGERTSIRLPGEQRGVLRNHTKWNKRSMLAVPLGQEVSVNSLQIARAAAVFINDGLLVEPYIVKDAYTQDGKHALHNERRVVRRVLKKGTSTEVLGAMKTSVEPGGTVSTLSVEGLSFAAKSGTAQIYDSNSGSYAEEDFTSSLLTVFPADKPRYVSYIVFHKPGGSIKWGGIIGATFMQEFLDTVGGYIKIDPASYLTIDPGDISVKNSIKRLQRLPALMPDCRNMTLSDAIAIFDKVDVKVKATGRGSVTAQRPPAGTTITNGARIQLQGE
jgi:cell division protein FtsI (penicillin-binding protein 3)